jgi:hypothetical protein
MTYILLNRNEGKTRHKIEKSLDESVEYTASLTLHLLIVDVDQ